MELVRFPSRGGFSVRSIITFVLTVLGAALLWATLLSTPTHAATTATWTGDNTTILFDEHGYTANPDFKDTTGTIPEDAIIYTAPVQTSESGDQEMLVLYFAPGTDPPTEKTIHHVVFDYNGGTLSNPHGQQTVELAPQGTSDGTGSSCSVGGIGWIICPVSIFLAESMDNLFNLIDDFIKTQPLMLGSTDNPLYAAWNVARTIANLAFVIVFLVIIYSQLTSMGVSNYGLKKLIPRLIVAAVLVNISYYVCAIAIDISNIIGYSIIDVFTLIRQDLFYMTSDTFADVNNNPWTAVTNVVLAGGGIVGGVYYLVTAGPYLVVTLLVGLGLIALFVLLVLAARQAIIIVLVIISPLAFVANLLPNTEKWFDKWKDIFATMLIFFPAFALVFGGSQLAGQLIIQNAGDNMMTVIFGLAVQVAPLVVTPYLLKLSGGLLGRIAQIANNPRKGIMDRTKGWQHEKNEMQRQRVLGSKRAIAKPFQILDNNRRARKSLTETYQKNADSRWDEENRAKKLAERAADADENKARVHSRHTAHINQLKVGEGHRLSKKVDLQVSAAAAESAKTLEESTGAQLSATMSAYRANTYDAAGNTRLSKMQEKMASNVITTAAWKQAETNNQYQQQQAISKAMEKDDNGSNTLLNIAQGSGDQAMRVVGRERAQANAIATLTKLNKDARDNTITLIETEAVTKGVSVKDFALQDIIVKANQPNSTVSNSRLEAALEIAISDGQVGVFDQMRESLDINQEIVDAVVARNVGSFKQKGGFHTQQDPQLSLQRYLEKFEKGEAVNAAGDVATSSAQATEFFRRDMRKARLMTLSNTNAANIGDLKQGPFEKLAADLLGGDGATTGHLLESIEMGPDGLPRSQAERDMVKRTFDMLRNGLSDPSVRATFSDRIKQVREIEEIYRERFFPGQEKLVLPGDDDYPTTPPATPPPAGTPTP